MHIVVVGAGEVGLFIAERLSREGHDVALIDKDRGRLAAAEERLDVQTVHGSGASPRVLETAGIGKAKLLVSVSNDDEANLVSSLVAKQAGSVQTIVRLQNDELRSPEASALRRAMGVDAVIDPDAETAQEIMELVRFPGASEIFRMVGGEVMIIGARLPVDAPLVGMTLHDLAAAYEPHWDFLIGAITRGARTIIPREDMQLHADDHLRVVCNQRGRRQLLQLLGLEREAPRRVMLLGGGHTARILAQQLQSVGASVVIVERKASRARELAERLDRCLVLEGEITDADLLGEEGVDRTDVVIALTGEDDANILACLYAKARGAKETIAVVHRLSLLPLVHQAGIDVALSPRTAIANAVLRIVRGGVSSVTTFLEGEAEILELVVEEHSRADGAVVAELPLPRNVLIGAVVRAGNAEIARGRTKLRDKDRVIAFAIPEDLADVKRIFGGRVRTKSADRGSATLPGAPRLPRKEALVSHVAGLVLLIAFAGIVASAIVEAIDGGRHVLTLMASASAIGLVGLALWGFTTVPERPATASIFSAVFVSWVVLSIAGALPYLFTGTFHSLEMALFESMSGFTTTGSTVLRPIEGTAAGVLFWRATTQWMGGIGVVVFAVSVLPYLGGGGMELLAAEAPGPSSERLVPRVRETAKRLVLLYVGFTTVLATAYAVFGMTPFDAVAHAFTTVSTGGFSTHDRSFAHFGSPTLEWISVAAMVFAGGSFALYWRALKGKPLVIVRSTEFRAYLALMAAIAGTAVAWNVAGDGFSHDLVRRTVFSTISLSSSTGYTILDYDQWHSAVKLMLIFAMGLGGMAGSTTGGFKVFRLLAVLGYARRQVFRQLHPRAVDLVRLGRETIPELIVARIVGFFSLFMAIGGLATFLVAATGTDPLSAISAVATSIGNVGPGLGEVGPTTDFLGLHSAGRAVLVIVMLVGRLEVFPVVLGLVPVFRWAGRRIPARIARTVGRLGSG